MTATGRAYIPPPAPTVAVPDRTPALDPPAPPVAVPPDWDAFAGPVIAGALGTAALWGAWAVLSVPGPGVLSIGGFVWAIIGWRLFWLWQARGRALGEWDEYRAYQLRAWDIDLEARERGYLAERQAMAGWLAAQGRAPKADLPPPVNNVQAQEQDRATFRAALVNETVKAVVAELAPLLQPVPLASERARVVASTPTDDAKTNHLNPGRALLTAAYQNGPVRRLVQTARAGDSISIRAMVKSGAFMSDLDWREGTDILEGIGVLVRKGQGPTASFTLAPDLATTPPANLDTLVVQRLVAADYVCGDIPGDMRKRDGVPPSA